MKSRFFTKRITIRGFWALGCCASLCAYACVPVQGAPLKALGTPLSVSAASKWWNLIEKSDARIQSCRVTWKHEILIPADSHADPKQEAKWAAAAARKEGKSDAEIAQAEKDAREMAQYNAQPHQVKQTFRFTRAGQIVRCDITGEDDSHSIDFFDGKNAVFMPPESLVENAHFSALLTREPREILSHSASSWQMPHLLLGVPLSQSMTPNDAVFSPATASLQETQTDLILESKVQAARDIAPGIHRLTISKKHGRTVAYEFLDTRRESNGRVVLSGYKEYPGGVWYPSRVSVSTRGFAITYTLVDAAFNGAVDAEESRLPANAKVSDIRFGPGKVAQYILKAGSIPSDMEVQETLAEQAKLEAGSLEARGTAQEFNFYSNENLRQLGLAARLYLDTHGNLFPLWTNSAAMKKSLLPLARDENIFAYPKTGEAYQPNTSLSGKKLSSVADPATRVLFYEASAALDETRGIAYADGHVKRIAEADWPVIKRASQIP